MSFPERLYHATLSRNAESILREGLKPCPENKMWAQSNDDCVCLSSDDAVSASFVEGSDYFNYHMSDEEYAEMTDSIVVFSIDVSKIDERLLFPDRNISNYESERNNGMFYLEYRGIIPPEALTEEYEDQI